MRRRIEKWVHGRSLAEVAIWYTVAVGASVFGLLFFVAGFSALRPQLTALVFLVGSVIWVSGLGWYTWRVARAPALREASVSAAPLHLFQLMLIGFTGVNMVISGAPDWDMFSALVLTWEVWGALFTLAFLGLATLAGRRLPVITWLVSIGTLLLVGRALWLRL